MKRRILVIEDNAENLELVSYLLRASGHEVLSAEDGIEGLQIAARERPEIILCDLRMPRADGYEVVRQLRDAVALRAICVIAVSASASDMDRTRALAAGFDGFLPKPIIPETFVEQVMALTTWVLGNALRQGRAWHTGGLPLDLSVNLSARNLQDPNLSTEILDLVRSSQFPLDRLTLEITESAIMTDPARAKSVLAVLHEGGIRFSMDDFGIGQSSLTYLKDLPISKMKIDKSFVMEFSDTRNAAIVRSAIELGHNLGLSVTAEGVEDRETYEALRNLGCDTAQGYFFSKPLPVDKLTLWLRQSDWKYAST